MSAATITVPLTRGLLIRGERKKNLVLREPFLADLLMAEEMASVATPLAFRAALVSVVLVSADDFHGPFSPDMLKGIGSIDWTRLSAGLREAEELGEAEPGDEPGS